MSRPLRIEYHGALYHVITRGNASKEIFIDDKDRQKFLSEVKRVVEFHNLIIHSYCLMDNHYHLLVETPDANLSRVMRDLNGNYTQYFNSRHNRTGHIFQGRYKSFLIEKETYLLEVARYIVLNPVRAHIISHPKEWKWSNYQAIIGKVKIPSWLTTHDILKIFSNRKSTAINSYIKFVKEGIDRESPYTNVSNGYILGSDQFVFNVWNRTNGSEEIKEVNRKERIVGRPTLETIFSNIKTNNDRNKAIKFAKFRCGYFATEIAKHIGIHSSVVGKICNGNYNIETKTNAKS